MSKKVILLGLTTTPNSNWREKIKEIDRFELNEIALFLTAIKIEERKKLYDLLGKSIHLKRVIHVHLRNDMELWELDFLKKKFRVKFFNIHSKNSPHFFPYEKYKSYAKDIFIENNKELPDEEELEKYGGLCIDFSHWQDAIIQNWECYQNNILEKLIEKFPIGCCHVSAVSDDIISSKDIHNPKISYKNYSNHSFKELGEFDYLKSFVNYLPNYISLELENSFAEQLKVKSYVEKIIN